MKKRLKNILIIVFVFIVCWWILFIVDSSRAKNEKSPIFAINTESYEDGGSKKYTGLFYNVFVLHYFNPDMNQDWKNEDGTLKDEYKDKEFITGVEVSTWFKSIDKIKDRN